MDEFETGGGASGWGLGGLARLSSARSRSISPENPSGAPGGGGRATTGTGAEAARDLGPGFKISPSWRIRPGVTATLADIEGEGTIVHLWMTAHPQHWRECVLTMRWDDEPEPSVAVPLGDFFGHGWGEPGRLTSLAVAVNPRGGFNCYWPMPFRRRAQIALTNLGPQEMVLYFQVDYRLEPVAPEAGYFHAAWRRSRPLADKAPHVILADARGHGRYVGTYLAWQSNHTGWWGEGEVKFYLDDDDAFPTIVSTGTEDYFGGAWNFEDPPGEYGTFSGPYSGFHQQIRPDGLYRSQTRFGMYRWHLMDPVEFQRRLRVTIQALGWTRHGRYLPLRDDIASVAYWYQREPHAPFAAPDPAALDPT